MISCHCRQNYLTCYVGKDVLCLLCFALQLTMQLFKFWILSFCFIFVLFVAFISVVGSGWVCSFAQLNIIIWTHACLWIASSVFIWVFWLLFSWSNQVVFLFCFLLIFLSFFSGIWTACVSAELWYIIMLKSVLFVL